MRTETFIFDGIKRAGGPQNAGNGACDDYQNLCFKYGSARAVRDFKPVLDGCGMEIVKAYRHNMGATSNLIVVTQNNNGTCSVSLVDFNEQALSQIASYADGARNSIDISSIGNILIIKCDEYNSVGGGKVSCWLWRDGSYSLWYGGRLPELPSFSVTAGNTFSFDEEMALDSKTNPTVRTIYEYIASMYNMANGGINSKSAMGVILICLSYTLFDGSETKPSAPVMYFLADSGPNITIQTEADGSDNIYIGMTATAKGCTLSLSQSGISSGFYSTYKELIKSINIYSTAPIPKYDLETSITSTHEYYISKFIDGENLKVGITPSGSIAGSDSYDHVLKLDEYDIPEAIKDVMFYKQAEIPLSEDTALMCEPVEFVFGETLLAKERMPVDSSGYLQYYGGILTYNNRLHIYGTSAIINAPYINWGGSSSSEQSQENVTVACLVHIRENSGDVTTFHSFNVTTIPSSSKMLLSGFISYPDSRAYKAELIFKNSSGTTFKAEVFLKPSDTYNFAYAVNGDFEPGGNGLNDMEVPYSQYSGDIPTSASARPEYSSPGQMVVSGQGNPAYFAPSNSYSFDGVIISVVPLTDTVSEAQFGQFPLAIFTTEGIWTLEQGSGDVLYSRSVKISNLSCSGDVIQTKTGVYFAAEGGIWRLNGRSTERISIIAEGDTDAPVVGCNAYAGCCMSDNTVNVPVKPTMADIISSKPYLGYDSFNDELYVGYASSEIEFSYVYNAQTGLWRSDTRRILHQSSGIAVLSSYGNWQDRSGDVVSMEGENGEDTGLRQVLIRTRPFLAGADCYKTVHRMIARCMADAGEYSLTDGKNTSGMLSMYLFGSDNLSDWTLIGGVQRDGVIDRLPIMKTAGSWRYLVIAIAGYMRAGGTISGIDMMIEDKYGGKIR